MRASKTLRAVPAVEKVLQALGETGVPRPAVTAVVRRELAAVRAARSVPDFATVVARIRGVLDTLRRARIQPLINGTGVVLHTNLGRAPLGPGVARTLAAIAADYSNLEYDLTSGARGARAAYLEHNLAVLCGAEAATVVNNCAAALLLVLRHFAAGARRQVVISRGELIQIGGGFRIPEILESSGAQLREVGTTNQTAVADYARAIGPETALILKVHRSNFYLRGFVQSPPPEELAALARRRRLPLVEDLGSGAVVKTETIGGLEHEPTPAEVLRGGVDLVCFSGDKLLGGPQAGVVAGKRRLVAALKRNPLFRALRCDKLILAALQTAVDAYLDGQAAATRAALPEEIPAIGLLGVTGAELRARAEQLVAGLAGLPLTAAIGRGQGQVGGGTLPQSVLESVTVDLVPQGGTLAELAERLRLGSPPVVGYVSGGRFKLDLRTIFPRQDVDVLKAIRQALA